MTVTLNEQVERDVSQRAKQLGISNEELVNRAVTWFLNSEPELQAELADWQRASWQAWDSVEESLK